MTRRCAAELLFARTMVIDAAVGDDAD